MRPSRRTVIFGVFCAAYFLSQFYRSANAVISRDLVRDISLDAGQLGLMTSLFYLSFAAVQLPLGAALDRHGARRVTPALMLAAALGSLIFASGHGFVQLAAGRALIGVGMAGVYMGALKAFSRWFGLRGFAVASSYLVGLGAVGALAAATPLAWLTQAVGWRAVFYWGTVAVVVSAASLFMWTQDAPPGSTMKGSYGGGSLGLIFRDLRFWRIATLDFALVGTFLSVQGLWGGPFLLDVFGLSRVQVGDVLVGLSIGAFAGYFAGGTVSQRYSKARMLVAAAALFTVSQVLMVAAAWTGRTSLVHVAFPIFGFAAAFNPLLMAHVREVFPTAMTGRAVTAVNLFGMGGAGLTQWFMGLIIGAFAHDSLGHYPPEAYATTFAVSTLVSLGAMIFYAPLARRRRVVA